MMAGHRMRRKLRNFAADETGTAAVEFGVVSSVFVIILFGIIYVALMLFSLASLQWAVERGARIASINKNATQSQIASAVNSYLTSVKVPQATVQYTTGTLGTVPVATINATFQRTFTVPLVSTFTINFSATTTVPQGS
jgi:Flp pilus assembly protein TadG